MTPTFTFQGAFTLALATNGLTGGVTPVATADQSDSVDLLASLTTPSLVAHTFVVATTSAAVGVGTETYAFSNLPAGNYSVRGRRTTAAMDGTFSSVLSAPQAVLIPSTGPAATLNLTF